MKTSEGEEIKVIAGATVIVVSMAVAWIHSKLASLERIEA